MSKASRQTISMIAMVNGVFITIDQYKLAITNLALNSTVQWGLGVCETCMVNFPETGNSHKNNQWCTKKLKEVQEFFDNASSLYSMIVLVSLAAHIMEDLTSKIKDPAKLKLLEPIADVVTGLSEQIDSRADQYDAYEEADRLLERFYSVIGFIQ